MDVKKMAKLANLPLSEGEKRRFGGQMEEISTSVEILKELKTASFDPLVQVGGLENVKREDVIRPFVFPDKRIFKVKAIF